MPLRPGPVELPPHSRLSRYDGLAADLTEDGTAVGVVHVRAEPWAVSTGGRLWWRRWSPWGWSALLTLVLADGSGIDTYIEPDELDAEIDGWESGSITLFHRSYRLAWWDPGASARWAREELGTDPPVS